MLLPNIAVAHNLMKNTVLSSGTLKCSQISDFVLSPQPSPPTPTPSSLSSLHIAQQFTVWCDDGVIARVAEEIW